MSNRNPARVVVVVIVVVVVVNARGIFACVKNCRGKQSALGGSVW